MNAIDPGHEPKPGDLIEVEFDGEWENAVIDSVKNGCISGVVTGAVRSTSFCYTVGSYRRNWRWSQASQSPAPKAGR